VATGGHFLVAVFWRTNRMHCADRAPCVHFREEPDQRVPLIAYAKRLATKAAEKAGATSEAMAPVVSVHSSGSQDNEDMQVSCSNLHGTGLCTMLGADVAFLFAGPGRVNDLLHSSLTRAAISNPCTTKIVNTIQ
jgi:hypothetical protein